MPFSPSPANAVGYLLIVDNDAGPQPQLLQAIAQLVGRNAQMPGDAIDVAVKLGHRLPQAAPLLLGPQGGRLALQKLTAQGPFQRHHGSARR